MRNIKKASKIKCTKLEIQDFLISDKLTVQEAKFLFKIRTNMLDFRANFKTKYGNNQLTNDYLLCPICSNHVDNEERFL